jgi:hypothetical protein
MVKFSEVKKLLRRRSMSLTGVRLVVLKAATGVIGGSYLVGLL